MNKRFGAVSQLRRTANLLHDPESRFRVADMGSRTPTISTPTPKAKR